MKALFKWKPLVGLIGFLLLLFAWLGFRFSSVSGHRQFAFSKDPERNIPEGQNIVAPADGYITYIEEFRDGQIPRMKKKGVSIPVSEHLKFESVEDFQEGVLFGIYMPAYAVHINRVPFAGKLVRQEIFNGPHMNMTGAEHRILWKQLVPGWTTFQKLLGLDPFQVERQEDFVLKSARESLFFWGNRGERAIVTRIADFYVGKILTWVDVGEDVEKGWKLGMITWGSQTDLLLHSMEGLQVEVGVGDYVLAGESVLATY